MSPAGTKLERESNAASLTPEASTETAVESHLVEAGTIPCLADHAIIIPLGAFPASILFFPKLFESFMLTGLCASLAD